MEVQEIKERWGPGPGPWLVFPNEINLEIMKVFSMSNDDEPRISFFTKLNKQVWNCCHGWLVLSIDTQFSLWNPVSLESISLPCLISSDGINACILSSDPSSLDSTVFLFDRIAKTIFFCRVNSNDNQWIRQCYRNEIIDRNEKDYRNTDYLHTPINCNGKLYCLTFTWLILVQIEVIENDGKIVLQIQPLVQLPISLEQPMRRLKTRLLVESCGDIFTINIVFEERIEKFGNDIIGIEVHKLNFSTKAWERTVSVGDRAFFFCDDGIAFSCSANLPGVRRNRIYFTRERDIHLYLYDIEEGTLSVRIPCPNSRTSMWIMPRISSTNFYGQLSENAKEEQILETIWTEAGETEEFEYNGRKFHDFHLDILKYISHKLNFFDYKSFGAVSIEWRRAAPPLEADRFLSPWLLYFQKNKNAFNIFDPEHSDRYLVQIPESLQDATLCHCKDGWLLMCQYTQAQPHQLSVYFVNPFTKNVIRYPDLFLESKSFGSSRFGFSCSPTSPCCVVIVLTFWLVNNPGYVNICTSKKEAWKRFDLLLFSGAKSFCSSQIFSNGAFYFMGHFGELGVLRLEGDGWNWNLHERTQRSYLYPYQGFLAECNGELISAFINDTGNCLVFKLNSSTMLWCRIKSLGKYTMYISRISSFLMIAKNPEMEDKIYLPRFHGNGAMISFCLKTGKYSSASGDGSSENWYNTREQLRTCWIQLN